MAEATPIALMLGDRYGVGPELVAAVLAERDAGARPLLLVGDRAVLQRGAQSAGAELDIAETSSFVLPEGCSWALMPHPQAAEVEPLGQLSAAAGLEVLGLMRDLSDAAREGRIAGIVYAPFNKQAMRIAGHEAGDELDWYRLHMKPDQVTGEINILGDLWTSRVTSHIPLRDVGDHITPETVLAGIELLHNALKQSGRSPRLALSALNPHAGEGGAYGREEIDILAPAIARAREDGITVDGPFPSDTIFPRALKEKYDGVVTLFHDQGQIALKMIGLGQGITYLAGLPVPVATPGHGTAYDIAGKGIARTDGLRAAIALVERMTD